MVETFPREDVHWGKLREKVRVLHYGADARQGGREAGTYGASEVS